MIYSSRNSHLGDCAWHLQILQNVPGRHLYWVPEEYRWQLAECSPDVCFLKHDPPEGLNTWIACGRFEGQGIRYEHNTDLIEYLVRWANAIAKEAGAPSVLDRKDMLMSFPAIQRNVVAPDFDVLVINSPPRSGQCPRWDQGEMNELIYELADRYRLLVTNRNEEIENDPSFISASLCNIGNLSLRAELVIGVASGPIWGALNIWRTCPIYVFLDPIKLDYGRDHPVNHAVSVADTREQLKRDGWL